MIRNVIDSLITFCIFFAMLITMTLLWAIYEVQQPNTINNKITINIPKGASVKAISNMLEDDEIISNALIFELYTRVFGNHEPIQAGEFEFEPQLSMTSILKKLQTGQTILHSITIPEGLSNFQIRTIIEQDDILSGDIETMPGEGYLLPETYNVRKDLGRQDFIDRLHQAKKDFLKMAWEERQSDLPITTLEEAVILASIVEKETALADEREKVAGVFVNRLRKNMRLQSDPTVIYALTAGIPPKDGPGALGRRLLKKDLDYESPYNTYRNSGLPPGPICNPGKASVRAVLNPAAHNYLYFVADGKGGHAFAETLDGHNKNVAAWRKIRRQKTSLQTHSE